MSGVRLALAFSVGERYLTLIIALASNMIIARLLTPAEIGVYSVTLAIIGIAQVMRDFGVASYLIQEKNLEDEHIKTAFGILLVLGFGIAFVLFAGAPLISTMYREPAMVTTLRICCLNFLLLPFSTVSLAMLRRDMQFKRLAVVNLAAAMAAAVATIGLAFLGFGVLSLVVGSVVLNLVTGVCAWVLRAERRILLPGFSQWRRLLNFGAQSSASGVITSISMDINDLALGRIMGFTPVAILSRAQGLMNMFHRDLTGALRNVAYPAFARTVRAGQALEPVYIASVTNITAVAWPFYGFLALFPLEILRVMYGPQWDSAAPLVPIFALAGAIAATSTLVSSVILAAGRVELVTKVELIFQPFRAVLIVAAALLFKSMLACAVALALALVVQMPMNYWVKNKCVTNDYRQLRSGLWRSAKLTAYCLAGPALIAVLIVQGVFGAHATTALFFAALVALIAWPLAAHLAGHPISHDPLFFKINLAVRRAFRLRPKHP